MLKSLIIVPAFLLLSGECFAQKLASVSNDSISANVRPAPAPVLAAQSADPTAEGARVSEMPAPKLAAFDSIPAPARKDD
jgi:hypothetical protein